MEAMRFYYPTIVKEIYLDAFGHMNHAAYLVLFEEARWEFITQNGYGIKKIKETGLGPIILEVKVNYLKELKARDNIIIESQLTSIKGKIVQVSHKMLRNNEMACTSEVVIGFFNLKERKLVDPTQEWLHAIGLK